jgi:hypothetical protein
VGFELGLALALPELVSQRDDAVLERRPRIRPRGVRHANACDVLRKVLALEQLLAGDLVSVPGSVHL